MFLCWIFLIKPIFFKAIFYTMFYSLPILTLIIINQCWIYVSVPIWPSHRSYSYQRLQTILLLPSLFFFSWWNLLRKLKIRRSFFSYILQKSWKAEVSCSFVRSLSLFGPLGRLYDGSYGCWFDVRVGSLLRRYFLVWNCIIHWFRTRQ